VKPPPARALLLATVCLALAAGLAACGHKPEVRTDAHTEGPYVDVGSLKYQVQVSRQLNPRDDTDRAYLQGIPPQTARLAPDETWFAVFVRVVNETDRQHPAAREFEVEDTQGRVFEPVSVGSNPFAYRPVEVPPDETLPAHGSPADASPIGGSMVLFKLTLEALANRPLELLIKSPRLPSREGVIELDV
jgi:hypothetical protein